MKRSSNVIRDRFRKVKTIRYGMVALCVSTAFVLSGCDTPQDVDVYSSLDECKSSGANPHQCESDYKNALKESEKVAPKYSSQMDCSSDFAQCQQTQTSGGIFWMPLMTGFHSGSLNYPSQPLYNSKGTYFDAGGNNYGSAYSSSTKRSVSSSSLAPKPPTQATTTRNGFGASVARSSSSSSRGGSFGG